MTDPFSNKGVVFIRFRKGFPFCENFNYIF